MLNMLWILSLFLSLLSTGAHQILKRPSWHSPSTERKAAIDVKHPVYLQIQESRPAHREKPSRNNELPGAVLTVKNSKKAKMGEVAEARPELNRKTRKIGGSGKVASLEEKGGKRGRKANDGDHDKHEDEVSAAVEKEKKEANLDQKAAPVHDNGDTSVQHSAADEEANDKEEGDEEEETDSEEETSNDESSTSEESEKEMDQENAEVDNDERSNAEDETEKEVRQDEDEDDIEKSDEDVEGEDGSEVAEDDTDEYSQDPSTNVVNASDEFAADQTVNDSLGMNGTSMSDDDIAADSQHHDGETVISDWGQEYGASADGADTGSAGVNGAGNNGEIREAEVAQARKESERSSGTGSSGTGSPTPALVAGMIVVIVLVALALCLGSHL